jgi:hypothetical protein
MPTRSIKVWNQSASAWENVGIEAPDTSVFLTNSTASATYLRQDTASATYLSETTFTAANQLISSSESSTPITISIQNDQIILSNQVFN